jgi:hypothetical protein
VCLDDIHYNEANEVFEIYLQRREIIEFKRSYWFWGKEKKIYGKNRVKSLLTVRQVKKVDIYVDDRLKSEHNSCFTLLFGVEIGKNEIYLGSLEESRGTNLCTITIKVKKLDIEYSEAVVKM